MRSVKRKWKSPTVRSYGTFETVTQDECGDSDKTWGLTDALFLHVAPVAVACSAS
jgi:hypothetical protein